MRKLASNLLPPEWWIKVLIIVLILPVLYLSADDGDYDRDQDGDDYRDDDADDEQSLYSLQVQPHGASLEKFLTHF